MGGVVRSANAPTKKVSDELAEALFNRNMPANLDYLTGLGKPASRRARVSGRQQDLANALLGTSAVQGGR